MIPTLYIYPMQREIDSRFPAFFQCDPDCYVTVAGLYISIVVGIRAAARHRKMDLDRDSLHKYDTHDVGERSGLSTSTF